MKAKKAKETRRKRKEAIALAQLASSQKNDQFHISPDSVPWNHARNSNRCRHRVSCK